MNLESVPQVPLLDANGQVCAEWMNYFTINSQNMILFFGNVGHLVPRRTSDDAAALSTSQYIGRSLNNYETKNEMSNMDGTFKNNTQNSMVPNALTPPAPSTGRLEFYADNSNQVSINANGQNSQVVLANLTTPMNFSSDGTNLFVTLGGVTKQVTLT